MTKTNYWIDYISSIREREIEIVLRNINNKRFGNGLEIGAGNGFQSRLLVGFVDKLVCTELNESRLIKIENPNIDYKICDAELIDTYFPEKSFDFIYSSNVLEHLPNVGNCIKGTYELLKDDGLAVHIMPSPFYAFCVYFFWYPSFFINFSEKLKRYTGKEKKSGKVKSGNNLKKLDNRSKFLELIQFPKPHGVSKYFIQELFAFRKKRWIKEFGTRGFEIKKILKGPAFSGLGFGFDTLRNIFEKLGFTSEYIFIMVKKIGEQ